jgi:hypothetical protein
VTYRLPIRKGDRVAIAPHHDLWMAGCRFGRVTDKQTTLAGQVVYTVRLDTGREVALDKTDLLGSVSRNK